MSAGLACVFDEPPISEYEQGVKDGIESALRAVKQVRYNPSSLHLRAASETVPISTVYVRIDHLDNVLNRLGEAVS